MRIAPIILPYPGAPGVYDLSRILTPADQDSLIGPDNTPQLQHWLDTVGSRDSRRVVGLIPAGVFRFTKPLFVTSPGVILRGQGLSVSTLMGTGWQPLIVTHPPAGWIDPLTRPNVAGILDESVLGRGFATLGRYGAIGLRNCTTLGKRRHDKPGTTFDGLRECSGITLEICFDLDRIQPGQHICGIGDGDPWGFYRDGSGQFSFSFWTGDPTNPEVKFNHNIPINLDGFTGVVRVRSAVDLDAWRSEATCNGKSVGSPIPGPGRPGSRLRAAWSGQPFTLGWNGPEFPRGVPTTNVTIYGLRLSGAFRSEPPSNKDRDRYIGFRDPDTLFYLPLTGGSGLTLDVSGGDLNDLQSSSLIVLDGGPPLNGVGSFTLENLTLNSGSPGLTIGQSLDVQIRNCEFSNGSCAVESLRTGAAYPITLVDCIVSGHDVPISLQTTLAYLDRVTTLSFGGPCAIQTRGANLTWTNSHIWFAGEQTQWYVDMRPASYGGKTIVRKIRAGVTIVDNLTSDDEDGNAMCKRAPIRVEQAGSNPTSVDVSNLYLTNLGPDAAVLELIAAETQEGRWAIPTVRAWGLTCGGKSQLVARVRGDWSGTIDASMAPSGAIDASGIPHHLTVTQPVKLDSNTP